MLLLAIGSISWIGLMLWQHNLSKEITLCPIKLTTGYPCPACGTSRSVFEIINGHFYDALYYNPLGYLAIVLSIVILPWVIYDVWYKKSSFYNFYIRIEAHLKKKVIYIPLILLILTNWIWNLLKQM
ncbi:MAG: DUF2752 domain-containing protein [Sphingobacteriia bacterium]|nr:DUF2752 domain-containing protein [Sphingobacteriia bacterium]